ncbi:Multicopper oxidase with three cupredoxin domains (includes cell division protein FtsP and spore coat protein CotA) [Geodermatophilus saharensis]|uniref:Multicopper oxidase with three cupredoxin domains (Includes cell division protein FtsP and spore coat protein CotA) n=1 Tax=Geodermatophilus saharensis TaxID=1137994 RepID=A0A239DIZ1_9ACTN|nr:multicopper oxidase family protein [Geodermatophilus saharensis]SNS31673.1 Multicopper oxidase with three cupredoxin domains (includes cell division protein FtsP and spore coat protein CotA) [Geodermatophilus saharensis]
MTSTPSTDPAPGAEPPPGPLRLTRRRALQLGGLGLLGASLGGTAWARPAAPGGPVPAGGDPLAEPPTLSSQDGVLRTRLEVAETTVTVGGRRARLLTYAGTVPGPTLRLRPGDRLQVQLVNRLAVPTNLHTHGLHVSPSGNADNTLTVHLLPGESFDYDIAVPGGHPPGTYWYHPHEHHLVTDQLWGGLFGAIVVEDPEEVPVTRDRVLVVSDTTLDASGHPVAVSTAERFRGREGELVLVDGQLQPVLSAPPGARERWRVVNACASRFLRLRLDGQQLALLAVDGGRLPEPRPVEQVDVLPGGRADLLVTTTAGTSELTGLPFPRMRRGDGPSAAPGVLATLQVAGAPVPALPPVPPIALPADLRAVEPVARRRLVLGMGAPGGRADDGHEGHDDSGGDGAGGDGGGHAIASIDGRSFDPARTDHVVRLGTVEEWTWVNRSGMDHPMHLHVWPVQVVAEDGRPVTAVERQDVVLVRAGGELTVRIPFTDFPGRTLAHCHISDHEDGGMMAVVEAVPG